MAAVHHLGFLEIYIFNRWYPLEVHCASPCHTSCRSVNLLHGYGRLLISRDGDRRPPSWIWYTTVWTTYDEHCGLSMCKIWLESVCRVTRVPVTHW